MMLRCGLQGDLRELRASVIEVALQNMVDSLDDGAPAEEGADDAMTQEQSIDERVTAAGEAHQRGSTVQSAAGEGLFEPLQKLRANDNTSTPGITDFGSQAIGKGVDEFDPEELIRVQPVLEGEDDDEFDDMLC
jgi:hypothetical protein